MARKAVMFVEKSTAAALAAWAMLSTLLLACIMNGAGATHGHPAAINASHLFLVTLLTFLGIGFHKIFNGLDGRKNFFEALSFTFFAVAIAIAFWASAGVIDNSKASGKNDLYIVAGVLFSTGILAAWVGALSKYLTGTEDTEKAIKKSICKGTFYMAFSGLDVFVHGILFINAVLIGSVAIARVNYDLYPLPFFFLSVSAGFGVVANFVSLLKNRMLPSAYNFVLFALFFIAALNAHFHVCGVPAVRSSNAMCVAHLSDNSVNNNVAILGVLSLGIVLAALGLVVTTADTSDRPDLLPSLANVEVLKVPENDEKCQEQFAAKSYLQTRTF